MELVSWKTVTDANHNLVPSIENILHNLHSEPCKYSHFFLSLFRDLLGICIGLNHLSKWYIILLFFVYIHIDICQLQLPVSFAKSAFCVHCWSFIVIYLLRFISFRNIAFCRVYFTPVLSAFKMYSHKRGYQFSKELLHLYSKGSTKDKKNNENRKQFYLSSIIIRTISQVHLGNYT